LRRRTDRVDPVAAPAVTRERDRYPRRPGRYRKCPGGEAAAGISFEAPVLSVGRIVRGEVPWIRRLGREERAVLNNKVTLIWGILTVISILVLIVLIAAGVVSI
jgi:hypothetical protein